MCYVRTQHPRPQTNALRSSVTQRQWHLKLICSLCAQMKCTSWRMLMAHIMLSKIIGVLSFGEDNWKDLVSANTHSHLDGIASKNLLHLTHSKKKSLSAGKHVWMLAASELPKALTSTFPLSTMMVTFYLKTNCPLPPHHHFVVFGSACTHTYTRGNQR